MNKERLIEAAPMKFWELAEKQARRSTLGTFKTGAVIFNYKTDEVIGKGCSHHREGISKPTFHAEEHALEESYGQRNYEAPGDLAIVILTLGRSMNWAYSSRPCASCATRLSGNVSFIHYAERMNNGDWIVNSESPTHLLSRVEQSSKVQSYAREQRIV